MPELLPWLIDVKPQHIPQVIITPKEYKPMKKKKKINNVSPRDSILSKNPNPGKISNFK